MKKSVFLLASLFLTFTTAWSAAPDLTYNGKVLEWNTEWQRAQCGSVSTDLGLPEISGIACSRVTPGYIWMQSDDYESYIIAGDETGQKQFAKVKFTKSIRWDWEDMSGGVYEGTNYLFIGAFGDNDETDGEYSIVFFEEPAIDPENPEVTITPSQIKFQYPGGKLHNAEALMYDNKEQMIYIITKIYYDVCQVFRLPFRLDYGSEMQTLEYICDLGVKADLGEGTKPDHGFHLVTAADVSPDGQYVLIKNHNNTTAEYSWILLWERDGDESLSETLKRQPQPLYCYTYEWQGEAICWLDNFTFYTTSDTNGAPPIYKYTKPEPIPSVERSFTIDGNFDDWADLTGLVHAEVSAGAELKNLYGMRWYADEQNIFFYLEFNADDALVSTIDILISTDENDATGMKSDWLWTANTADYLVEGSAADFAEAGVYAHNGESGQRSWKWTELSLADVIHACAPVTLANGHKAIEGYLAHVKFPAPVQAFRLGVFTGKKDWGGDSGMLPASGDQMIEVPIYTPSTAIETTTHETGARKVLRNGQILILREGKTYSVHGQLIAR